MDSVIHGPGFPNLTTPLTFDIVMKSIILVITILVAKWVWATFLTRSSLYSIPGPPPQSWIKGALSSPNPQLKLNERLGNLGQLFNAKGMEFHQNLVDRYGGMVKVYGFFGVS